MAYLGDSLPCRFSADKNLLANVERGETQVRRQLRLNAGFLQRVSIALAMQSAVLAMIDSVCLTV